MARSAHTRRRRSKKDSTGQSVDFFNNLSWNSGGEDNDGNTSPRTRREPQHVDSTSRNRNSPDNSRLNVFEVAESPDPETQRSPRRNLRSPSKQASMEKRSINESSPLLEADGSEEEEEEQEQEENHDMLVKEEHGEENEGEGEDDEDAENERDQGSSASDSDSSDSDSSLSESAKQLADENKRDINVEVELPMPPLGHFGDGLSKESNGADNRSQSTDGSGERDNSESGDDENSGEESQRSEEIDPQSGSEYHDSENEQPNSEQETFETPPQQLGNNHSDSENQPDEATLGGNSRVTKAARRSQAGQLSLRPTINRKRKERPSLTERASKSPRVEGQISHSASVSADPSGHGFVQWEYDMEAENQPQRDTTADADDLLFEEAIQVMGLQRSWKRLMSGCHDLRTREIHLRPVYLGIETLRGHIFNMKELYKQMQEDRRTGTISVDLKDDLQKEGEFVREKAIAILTKLVNRAGRAKDSDDWEMKDEASTLAELIILDVVTELGDLAKECLKAYYSESTLAEGGFVAILEVLETMRLLDGKIFSLRSCYRINVLDYGRDLRSALSTLWKRLDQGEFYARQQKRQRPAAKQRPWTEDEEAAVIERLQQYEGEEERYRYVAEDYADEVGGRTENEIRKKAKELYDDYLQAKNISLTFLL